MGTITMAPFSVAVLPGEPIILVTLDEDFNVGDHIHLADAETRDILSNTQETFFDIIDTTRWRVDFDQMLQAASAGARGEDPIWKHPQIRRVIFVTQNRMLVMAAHGLRTATFGNLEALVFNSLDEALTWCRAQMVLSQG